MGIKNINEQGFKCVVVLTKGTNTVIEKEYNTKEDCLLFARNKWLIAHPESGLEKEDAFVGLKGESIIL